MKSDPRIDAKIAEAAPFAQPILRHLRALVHQALPEAEETIKWGMPHFTVGGKNVAGIAAFKAHAALIIHGEAAARGEGGRGMGALGEITDLAALPPDAEIISRLCTARDHVLAGKPTRVPRAVPPMPDDLGAALAQDGVARANFDGFAASHRREYIEWVTSAKRAETRARRISQAVERLREGRKFS